MTERAKGTQIMRMQIENSIKCAFACVVGGAMYVLCDLVLILLPLPDTAIYV